MASRPNGFGLTAELQRKKDGKYDAELERQAKEWMCTVLTHGPDYERIAAAEDGVTNFQLLLKDGVVLCNVINKLGGNIKRINSSAMVFKQMENIGNFLDGCEKMGVANSDLFQTVDLYEGQNMPQVINGLHALGRKAGSMGFPAIGPKEAESNKREFTEEQLRAGQGVIGLQAGSNRGASQAGQNFGKTRQILD